MLTCDLRKVLLLRTHMMRDTCHGLRELLCLLLRDSIDVSMSLVVTDDDAHQSRGLGFERLGNLKLSVAFTR